MAGPCCPCWLWSLAFFTSLDVGSGTHRATRDLGQTWALRANYSAVRPDNDKFLVHRRTIQYGSHGNEDEFPWIQPFGTEFYILKPSHLHSRPYFYLMDAKDRKFIRVVVTHIVMQSEESYLTIMDYMSKPTMTYITVRYKDYVAGDMVRPVYQSCGNALVFTHNQMGLKAAYLQVVFWFTDDPETEWKPRPWVRCPTLNNSLLGGQVILSIPQDLASLGFNESLGSQSFALDCTWHFKQIQDSVSFYVRLNSYTVDDFSPVDVLYIILNRYLYISIEHDEASKYCPSCLAGEYSGRPSVGKTYFGSAGVGMFLRMILNIGSMDELSYESLNLSFSYGVAVINKNITADPTCKRVPSSFLGKGIDADPDGASRGYSCIEGRHSEPSYQWCIPYKNHCDGIKNCPSGSDEHCHDGTFIVPKVFSRVLTMGLLSVPLIFLMTIPVVMKCAKHSKWSCLQSGQQTRQSQHSRQHPEPRRSRVRRNEARLNGTAADFLSPAACNPTSGGCEGRSLCPLILQQEHLIPVLRPSILSMEDLPPPYSEAVRLPRVCHSQSKPPSGQEDGLPSYDSVAHIRHVPGEILRPKQTNCSESSV